MKYPFQRAGCPKSAAELRAWSIAAAPAVVSARPVRRIASGWFMRVNRWCLLERRRRSFGHRTKSVRISRSDSDRFLGRPLQKQLRNGRCRIHAADSFGASVLPGQLSFAVRVRSEGRIQLDRNHQWNAPMSREIPTRLAGDECEISFAHSAPVTRSQYAPRVVSGK